MNETPPGLSQRTVEESGDETFPPETIFQPSPLVKNATAAYLSAKSLSLVWKVIQLSPFLENVERNVFVLWEKAKLLNHPYVCLDRGFVFIHVPKTAGTSLSKALGLPVTQATSLHARAKDVMPFVHIIAPKAIALAFVRNPYTRFVSLYNFARMDESLYHSTQHPEKAPYGKHPDHDLLSDKSLEACAELLVQGKLGNPTVWPNNWIPQTEWLVDRENNLAVDFIGHVESIEADLLRLEQVHGISSQPIPWLNKSSDSQEKPALTPRTLDLLRLYYKRDFELLGYEE